MSRNLKKERKAFDAALTYFNEDKNELVHAVNTELKKKKFNMVSLQAVMHWRKGGIPSNRVRIIETATNGTVTREELRPDLFS